MRLRSGQSETPDSLSAALRPAHDAQSLIRAAPDDEGTWSGADHRLAPGRGALKPSCLLSAGAPYASVSADGWGPVRRSLQRGRCCRVDSVRPPRPWRTLDHVCEHRQVSSGCHSGGVHAGRRDAQSQPWQWWVRSGAAPGVARLPWRLASIMCAGTRVCALGRNVSPLVETYRM